MRRSRRSKWVSGIGAVVLSGGLVVAGYGISVTPAEANITLVNPFPIIIDKLNQILAKLSTSAGGNHTLRWDTNNASATCFTTAFTGAVLDNNTGLVWEHAPDATDRGWQGFAPDGATNYCVNKNVGGTRGWRLPSVVELVSLIDPALPAPFVPASAFTIGGTSGVQSGRYWSASTYETNPSLAWTVLFNDGFTGNGLKASNSEPTFAWCVRGGMNADTY